jgi:hypothetical protein
VSADNLGRQRFVGDEGDEVRASGYVGREAKAVRCGEQGGKDGRVGAR